MSISKVDELRKQLEKDIWNLIEEFNRKANPDCVAGIDESLSFTPYRQELIDIDVILNSEITHAKY